MFAGSFCKIKSIHYVNTSCYYDSAVLIQIDMQVKRMVNKEHEQKYDLSKIYTYEEHPDNKISGRCDNCGNSVFKSSIKNFIFSRECRHCSMKKII